MDEKQEIVLKESLEILEGVELLLSVSADVMKDGKVDLKDIVHLVRLGKEFEKIHAAIDNFSGVKGELEDLNKEEIVILVIKLHDIFMKIKEIIKNKSKKKK